MSVISPSTPAAELEPFIVSRLRAPGAFDADRPAVRSDYDLNPTGRRAARALTQAAVLVALVERDAGLSVILTRRADALRRHSGQIAFPGGRADAGETPVQTALRETEEEIGLNRRFVRVAGLCDTYETGTGYAITPVVGFVAPGFVLTRHEAEVAEIFETPFAFLMDPANHELRVAQTPDGVDRRFYAMPFEDRTIWGATAGIIRGLYERLFGGEEAS